MKILITGGSGMMGRHLIPLLKQQGHEVVNVSRTPKRNEGEISWDDDFHEVDAAIHLAGRNLGDKRWTESFIKELYASRVETAQKLKLKLTPRCKVIITASGANGYPFGDFTSPPYTEEIPFGQHICGQLCAAWENVWLGFPARVVALRIGFVIGSEDSGLKMMLPFYKMGLGGVIGDGRQRMSWIAIDDLIKIFAMVLTNESYRGPINAVAPQPVTFREFNNAFARAVHRPAFWPIPGFAVKILFGKLADELILADYPATPKKLLQLGFSWDTPTIDEALMKAVK